MDILTNSRLLTLHACANNKENLSLNNHECPFEVSEIRSRCEENWQISYDRGLEIIDAIKKNLFQYPAICRRKNVRDEFNGRFDAYTLAQLFWNLHEFF